MNSLDGIFWNVMNKTLYLYSCFFNKGQFTNRINNLMYSRLEKKLKKEKKQRVVSIDYLKKEKFNQFYKKYYLTGTPVVLKGMIDHFFKFKRS